MRESGSRGAKIGHDLREIRSPKSRTILKYDGKYDGKLRAKFATSTKYMVKRVSKSSVKGIFAQMQYGEERNSVNFR